MLATLTLSPLDGVVVTLFVVAILALGFSAKIRESSVLQFLAAGRSLTLPVFVATLVSTWYGGILGVGESVSYYGLGTWLLIGVPYYVFALIYAFWLAPKVRGAEQISLPERLASRWGRGAGLTAAALVFLLAVPAAHVLMLGVLVQQLTGWDKQTAIVAATIGGTLFLYKGGLLADVRAGMLAFVMMYVGFGVIVGWCLIHHPPAATFAKIEGPGMLSFTGGQAWPAIVSFFILGAWTLVDPGFHQRVASARDPQTGVRGVLVSVFFWFLFDVLSITTGMYALALLKPLPKDTLAIFPELGNLVLPPGLKAVFLCGMLGTITSAMVGYTLVGGASFGRELVGRLTVLSEDGVKRWTRAGFAVACFVAVVLALQIESVVALWYAWAGCIIGALLIPVGLAYTERRRSAGIGGASARLASVSATPPGSEVGDGDAPGASDPRLSNYDPSGIGNEKDREQFVESGSAIPLPPAGEVGEPANRERGADANTPEVLQRTAQTSRDVSGIAAEGLPQEPNSPPKPAVSEAEGRGESVSLRTGGEGQIENGETPFAEAGGDVKDPGTYSDDRLPPPEAGGGLGRGFESVATGTPPSPQPSPPAANKGSDQTERPRGERAAGVRPRVLIASMILAFGVSFVWLVQTQRTNNPFQEVAWIQSAEGWKFALPPDPAAEGPNAVKFSVGTLLPGLVISALVIGLGEAIGRRKTKE